jgi:hypothetical protein
MPCYRILGIHGPGPLDLSSCLLRPASAMQGKGIVRDEPGVTRGELYRPLRNGYRVFEA